MNIVRTTIRRLWSKNLAHTPKYNLIFQPSTVTGLCIIPLDGLKVGMMWHNPLRVVNPHDVREVTNHYQSYAQEYIE